MGRGVSSGGGQSSLGYLFGSDGAPKTAPNTQVAQTLAPVAGNGSTQKSPTAPSASAAAAAPASASASPPAEVNKQIPAGIQGNTANNANNYFRADGQNCGNFITERPSTKVHSAPGGGSSLGYLFGNGGAGGGGGN